MSSTATVLEHVPFVEYAQIPAVHATALKYMLISPRAYRQYVDSEDNDNDTLRQGRAAHTAVLEPMRFLADFVLWDGKVRRDKEWEAFKAKAGERTILTLAQYETARMIGEAVNSHKLASQLLRGGKAEMSIRWPHPSGVLVKCRLDYLGSAIIDLKTTRDPRPAKFSSSAASFGYDMQAALYADAAAAAGFGALPYKIVAAQSVEPFDVAVYDLPEALLTDGRAKYEKALDLYVECTRNNSWPGMAPDEELTLRLPMWAAPDYDEEGPDTSTPIEDTDF